MGDDQHQEGWINCSFHPGAKPTHSSPGEPDVRKHDRFEEGDDQEHGARRGTQVYRDGYEEEIATLVEKNDDLKKKLKVSTGFPTTGGEDDDCTCP